MAGFIPSFIFGGDTGNTPEALKLQRQMAMQAMLAQDSPKNVGEGFNSIGRSIAAALMDRQASEQEKAGQAGALEAMRGSETLGPLLGGGGGLSSMPAPTGGAGTPAQPQGLPRFAATDGASPSGTFAEIAPKLSADLQRDFGLSQAQTAGVVGNLAHESGGFGSLQEKNPLVPGSRGGFGYAQWTGPRRVAFENWSAQNGLDPTSYDANYGFLKHELTNTPEGRVLGALKQAPDAQAATRVFSDQFLRPGIPGMESRMKWADRAMAGQPVQVASASPDALPIPPGQYLAQRQAEMDQAARDSGPATPAPAQAPVLGANGLPSPFVKQQVAQASPAQMGGSLSPGDRAALANPFVPQSMKEIIIKKATRDPTEMQLKQLELQKAQRDVNGPGYSLDIQGKQLANQKARRDLQGMGYRSLTTPEDRAKFGVPPEYKGAVQVDRDGQLHFPGKAGTEVTLKNEGNIPPGYKATRDENGNIVALEAIPGGEAATKVSDAKKKETERAKQAAMKGNVVLNSLDDIDRLTANSTLPTSGLLGSRLSSIPGTAAHDVSTALNTIGANISFENLNQMRQASPTGGALGAVSDHEQKLLQNAWGALQQSQSPEQFKRNLDRVRTMFNEVIHGKEAAAKMAAERMGGVREIRSKEDYDALPSGSKFIDPEGKTRVKP